MQCLVLISALGLLLLPAYEVQGQPVSLTLQIDEESVPVLPAGGTVTVDVLVEPSGSSTQLLDLWLEATTPDGILKPRGPRSVDLASRTLILDFDIILSEHDPSGVYTLNAYLGTYPDVIIDSTSDSFSKISEAKFTASDGAADDWFGLGLSISGDYALVGAHRDDDNGSSSGSAYVFRRDGDTWLEDAKLTEEDDGSAFSYFGNALSLSGDYALIGAWRSYPTGAAYIFHRDGVNWIREQKIISSSSSTIDQFGYAVDLQDDYAAVSQLNDGFVYIYYRGITRWVEEAKLEASDTFPGNRFGVSVSISGDYVLVGAESANENKGAAYIYHRNGHTWTEEAILTASDGEAIDLFGCSVSLSGEYALIGAMRDDDFGVESGSAYVFHRSENAWTEEAKCTAYDGDALDFFGESVSMSGDYAVIGSPYGNMNKGSVWIFRRQESGEWVLEANLEAFDAGEDDAFGKDVFISGDDLLVGAVGDDDNGTISGSAYAYSTFISPEMPHSLGYVVHHEGAQAMSPFRNKVDGTSLGLNILQNSPNPFNPSTSINYALNTEGFVTLKIYNTLGEEVATLVNEFQNAGYKSATWNGRNDAGSPVASGIYIYRFAAGSHVQTGRMLLMK